MYTYEIFWSIYEKIKKVLIFEEFLRKRNRHSWNSLNLIDGAVYKFSQKCKQTSAELWFLQIFGFGIEAASGNGEEKFVEWSLEGAKAAGNTGVWNWPRASVDWQSSTRSEECVYFLLSVSGQRNSRNSYLTYLYLPFLRNYKLLLNLLHSLWLLLTISDLVILDLARDRWLERWRKIIWDKWNKI